MQQDIVKGDRLTEIPLNHRVYDREKNAPMTLMRDKLIKSHKFSELEKCDDFLLKSDV